MEINKSLNWTKVFTIKHLSEYFNNTELISFCFNREIRESLKPFIFKQIRINVFSLNRAFAKRIKLPINDSGRLEAELNLLMSDLYLIQAIVKNLSFLGSINQLTLTKCFIKFSNLTRLNLDSTIIKINNFNLVLSSLEKLEGLQLKDCNIDFCKNTDIGKCLYLPINLKFLSIIDLTFINIIRDSYDHENGYDSSNRYILELNDYIFKSNNLQNLKNLIIHGECGGDLESSIKSFLINNNNTIQSLFTNAKYFYSEEFININNNPKLKKLFLRYDKDQIDYFIEEPITKLIYIQHLTIKPYKYADPIQGIGLINLYFPNLTSLECGFIKQHKKDMIQLVSALPYLKKLTLTHRKSLNYINFNLISYSLKVITFDNILVFEFKPIIAEKCPNLKQINLTNYDAKEKSIEEVRAHFEKFNNWKTLIFPKVIRLYSSTYY